MHQFWWVNHKKTAADELAGGYIWSPKKEASGARSQFYDNLRRMIPGDRIVSYANGTIKAIGLVTDFSMAMPKPTEFGRRGVDWDNDGWLVPIKWQTNQKTIRPRDFLEQLSPLLPRKYSPLQAKNGHGNQKAYLSEISSEIFDLVSKKIGEPDLLMNEEIESTSDLLEKATKILEEEILLDSSLSLTARKQLILARRGQGIFRKNVFLLEKECRCTGAKYQSLLIAGHIKPWIQCKTSLERLDGNNGLMLTPTIDRLFDKGLISFESSGKILVSKTIPADQLLKLGAKTDNPRPFSERQSSYLTHHRENVFRG
jgi:putative restriction endonuclease